jgi:rhodanese-related sulfurtransferase
MRPHLSLSISSTHPETAMQEFSVQDAASAMADENNDVVLLDVRENDELQAAAVSGALHIPMGQIPTRMDELDKDRTILCLCHAGGRSAQVAQYLSSQGYTKIFNVSGGIDAWSLQIDPQIPRY